MAAPWAKHGAVVKMDATTSATAVTDYSSSVLSVTVTPGDEVGTHYTVDSRWPKRTRGGNDFQAEITVVAGSALHQRVLSAWEDAEAVSTFELYKPDSTSGSLKFSGEGMIQASGDAFAAEGGSGDVDEASFTILGHSTIGYEVVT